MEANRGVFSWKVGRLPPGAWDSHALFVAHGPGILGVSQTRACCQSWRQLNSSILVFKYKGHRK